MVIACPLSVQPVTGFATLMSDCCNLNSVIPKAIKNSEGKAQNFKAPKLGRAAGTYGEGASFGVATNNFEVVLDSSDKLHDELLVLRPVECHRVGEITLSTGENQNTFHAKSRPRMVSQGSPWLPDAIASSPRRTASSAHAFAVSSGISPVSSSISSARSSVVKDLACSTSFFTRSVMVFEDIRGRVRRESTLNDLSRSGTMSARPNVC